jgi:hypothetical protein
MLNAMVMLAVFLTDAQQHITADNPLPVSMQTGWHDNLGLIFSGLLVLIASFGVLYAKRTLNAIKGQLVEIKAAGLQTDQMIAHAGKQAEAALLNAHILANAERPWILIYSEHIPDTKAYGLYAKNCGRTPARIVLSSKDKWTFLTLNEVLQFEPKRPHYGTISPLHEPIILLPQESTYILSVTDLDVRRKCESEERFESVKAGSLELYIYGTIAYRDLLQTDSDSFHETAWCCHYLSFGESKNRLSMFGLPGYTYHT